MWIGNEYKAFEAYVRVVDNEGTPNIEVESGEVCFTIHDIQADDIDAAVNLALEQIRQNMTTHLNRLTT